jgi:predicted Ser/Thr protein kinase
MLRRDDLDRQSGTILSKPSAFKPSVRLVETAAGPVVVKDSRQVGVATRWIARWLLARERRILERVSSLDAVPHVLAAMDRDAIVLAFVAGRPLDRQSFRARPRKIIEQLVDLTRQLHELGVFHLDLHMRKNLLLDDEGRLRVIDFGSAVAPGPVLRAFLGGLLRHIDNHAPCKYLARFAPEELSDEEARAVLRHRWLRVLWPFSPLSKGKGLAARARLTRKDLRSVVRG